MMVARYGTRTLQGNPLETPGHPGYPSMDPSGEPPRRWSSSSSWSPAFCRTWASICCASPFFSADPLARPPGGPV